jgi:hypothetical protein
MTMRRPSCGRKPAPAARQLSGDQVRHDVIQKGQQQHNRDHISYLIMQKNEIVGSLTSSGIVNGSGGGGCKSRNSNGVKSMSIFSARTRRLIVVLVIVGVLIIASTLLKDFAR